MSESDVGGTFNVSNLNYLFNGTIEDRLRELEARITQLEQRKSLRSKPKLRPISDDDKPSPKHYEFGRSLNVQVGPEWGKFKNYCLAHGKRYENFESAFRNWLANSVIMNGGKRT